MTTVGELKAAPYNPRRISKEQLASLGRAMREFGDLSGIVLNMFTGHIVGGHQRLKNLNPKWEIEKTEIHDSTGTVATGWIQTPWGRISYREVKWAEEKEKAANLAANKMGGEFDLESVASMLRELEDFNFDLDLTGFDSKERLDLLGEGALVYPDEGNVPGPSANPKTRPGNLFILGGHRLFCGDARNGHDVAIATAGCLADCMWTDPPYGVSYVGKTKEKKQIQNDGKEYIAELIGSAFAMANSALQDGAAIYIAHPPGALSVVFGNAFIASGWRLHETLVWVKDSMVLGHSDYHYRHEPIYFGYKGGEGRRGRGGKGWYGRDDETSVFEIPRPKASEEHPTMKPVALIEIMVRNSSPRDGLVYDPFGGSGSTLLACERSGRRCAMLEIDPAYCDVIVKRWESFTGQKATIRKG